MDKLGSHQKGFTLLEQVTAISVMAITSATATQYIDDWYAASEEKSIQYTASAATYAMLIKQSTAKAQGQTDSTTWQQAIEIRGIKHEINGDQLRLISESGSVCKQLNKLHLTVIEQDC